MFFQDTRVSGDSYCSTKYWCLWFIVQLWELEMRITQSECYHIFPMTELCEASTAGNCSRMLAYEGIATARKTLTPALRQESRWYKGQHILSTNSLTDTQVSISCPQRVSLLHRLAYPVHRQPYWCTGQHILSINSPTDAQVSISCPQADPLMHRSAYPVHKQPHWCTCQCILSTNSPTDAQVNVSCPPTVPLLHRSAYPVPKQSCFCTGHCILSTNNSLCCCLNHCTSHRLQTWMYGLSEL
jgi:hypothetical protein